MDHWEQQLSLIRNAARRHAFQNDWELVGTALKDTTALQISWLGVILVELQKGACSEYTWAPSKVIERLQALSVHEIDKLRILASLLESIEDENHFIINARNELNVLLSPQERLDTSLPPWRWLNEVGQLAFLTRARNLAVRPLEDRYLSAGQLHNATRNNGLLLRALRAQTCTLDPQFFWDCLDKVSTLDSAVLSLVIELSRRSSKIQRQDWLARLVTVMQETDSPKLLIPSFYAVVSDTWVLV